jgi:hypothetical protein
MGRACCTYIKYNSEYSFQFHHSGFLVVGGKITKFSPLCILRWAFAKC